MSPFELPPARTGRRPIRLQIRTGFAGPSSKTSGSARYSSEPPCSSSVYARPNELPTTRSGGIVELLRDHPHEIAAPAGSDEAGEAVPLEEAQQLHHRDVPAVAEPPAERRVGRVVQERRGSGRELLDRLTAVGPEDALHQDLHVRIVARVVLLDRAAEPGVVLFAGRLPRLLLPQRLVGLGHRRQSLEDEAELDRHGLLTPERPVVVEDRDPLLRREVAGRGLREVDDRLGRRGVVPGAERRHPRAPLVASAIFSSAWSIVKLAAFCRGGKSLNVPRKSATIACAARSR
jgi:hypothetical protein